MFSLIAEGPTDIRVLKYILMGWYNNPDLIVKALQPKPETDDEDGRYTDGNWHRVLEYCGDTDFKNALEQTTDFVVVQIDTDIFKKENLPKKYKVFIPPNTTTKNTIDLISNKIKDTIGLEFYKKYENRIIFAIAVDEIECWFLPIYFENQPKKSDKTTGCLDVLNTELNKKEGFYIKEKNIRFYDKIAKKFLKQKDLKAWYKKNQSFESFINALPEKQQFPQ